MILIFFGDTYTVKHLFLTSSIYQVSGILDFTDTLIFMAFIFQIYTKVVKLQVITLMNRFSYNKLILSGKQLPKSTFVINMQDNLSHIILIFLIVL